MYGRKKESGLSVFFYNSTKKSRQNFIFVCAQCRHSDITTFRARAALYYHCLDEEKWGFGEKNANQLHSVTSLEYFAAVDFMFCTKKDFSRQKRL